MTDVEPPPPLPKRHLKRTNYALGATLIASGLTYDEAALQTGAANGESLRRGLARKGVTARHVRTLPISAERDTSVTARLAEQAAEIIKGKLGGRLHEQIATLSKRKVGPLANRGQGEAAVLKTMAETWRTLNGSPDSITFSFGASAQSSEPVVERITVDVPECPAQSQFADEQSA